MKLTRAAAELQLGGCQGCSQNCNGCQELNAVLDSLMVIRLYTNEISAAEDAEEMEIERLLAG